MIHIDYNLTAKAWTKDLAIEYIGEIVDQLKDDQEASWDLLNDYIDGDSRHHETFVDHDWDLEEAAAILDQLYQHEETDWGLWQGLEPRKAIAVQAAYTMGNAGHYHWQQLIKEINHDAECGILKDMLGEDDPASEDVIFQRVKEIIEDY